MQFCRAYLLRGAKPPFLTLPVKNFHNLNHTQKPNLENFMILKRFQFKAVKCWQCGIERKNITELFCEQCHYIQSPQDRNNYFKVFEFDETFDIDLKELTKRYRQMQNVLHPDRFTNRSNSEQNISEEFSSLVNKAYNILQSPLMRAVHLLNLRGGSIEESQKIEDPEFLMEIMELNEEVENADNEEKLRKLKLKNDRELRRLEGEIKRDFNEDGIEKAKENIVKMRYFNSVGAHINGLMRERGIVD